MSFDPQWFSKAVEALLREEPEPLSRFEIARILFPSPADGKLQAMAAGWMQHLFRKSPKIECIPGKPKRYRLKPE